MEYTEDEVDYANSILEVLEMEGTISAARMSEISKEPIESIVHISSMKIIRLMKFIQKKTGYRFLGGEEELSLLDTLHSIIELYRESQKKKESDN